MCDSPEQTLAVPTPEDILNLEENFTAIQGMVVIFLALGEP